MTPERAEMILRGLLGSLQGFAEEVESFESMCPELRHLKLSILQCRLTLRHLIERDSESENR